MHYFIALGNILASQFKEEAKKQKEADKKATQGMPNISNISNMLGSISSNGIQMPQMPQMPSPPKF